MSAFDLANALIKHPLIVKPLLAACNIAARAIERDLSIKNVDTYAPRLDAGKAEVIAGYIKPFLPTYLEIPALVHKRMFTADNEQFELDAATPRVFRRAALCRSYIRESN
jgi:hypothetical protein